MTAREEILAAIRTALHVQVSDPGALRSRIARRCNRIGKLDRNACLDLFLDRLIDYDAEIIQIATEIELPTAIAEALNHTEKHNVLIAPSFPAVWLPEGIAFKPDNDLPIMEIESSSAVITTCEAAVATTGTILLVHRGAQGRRVLTLLPDHHICLVRRDQVFELLPQTLQAIAPNARQAITTISGPSATSDIEMTRIRGVHGPRRLTAILYS